MNTLTNSGYAITAPNEEFFSTLRYWLVIGGIITRGLPDTTAQRFGRGAPTAAAASSWPFGTARMPPRTIRQ